VTFRSWISALICLAFWGTAVSAEQIIDDRIASEHIRIRIPLERQSLAREAVADLERCWKFMAAATDNSLPRQVLVIIRWDQASSSADFKSGSISIGMENPAAAQDTKTFVVHNSARQLARLGLSYLSRGAAFREDTRFLAEGMAEILVREYEHTARSLSAAWILAHFLDELKLLGLTAQSSWTAFSDENQSLRNTAPGVTFLVTCRELHGRDKLLKLFETMGKGSLEQALADVFRTSAASLEAAWLQRVRAIQDRDDILVTTSEDAPRVQPVPERPAETVAGSTLQVRFIIKDGGRNLSPDGVFLRDEASNQIVPTRPELEKGISYFRAEVPVEPERRPGEYGYVAIAIDDAGNVCHQSGRYTVK